MCFLFESFCEILAILTSLALRVQSNSQEFSNHEENLNLSRNKGSVKSQGAVV